MSLFIVLAEISPTLLSISFRTPLEGSFLFLDISKIASLSFSSYLVEAKFKKDIFLSILNNPASIESALVPDRTPMNKLLFNFFFI